MIDKETFDKAVAPQLKTEETKLGPFTSYSLINDPKHMCFVLSRYKFCAKMLEGKDNVLEIGCGDGFGTPIVAQGVRFLTAIDTIPELIKSNTKRIKNNNIIFENRKVEDLFERNMYEGTFSVDVLEHLNRAEEIEFMDKQYLSLKDGGVCIIGTPNKTSSIYATERSSLQHINLKTYDSLKSLMNGYYKCVFMFGMNDEVLHTGYGSMCHYLFGVGVK